MKFSLVFKAATAAAVLAVSGSASAQLYDQGSFGQATYSSASSGYSPGRLMKWNNTGSAFNVYCIDPYTGTALPGSYSTMDLTSYTNGTSTSGYAQQLQRGGSYSSLDQGANAQLTVRKDITELFSWAYADAITNTAKAAAFGLVLWEIIVQGSGNGTTTGGNGGTAYSKSTTPLTITGGDSTAGNGSLSGDSVEYWVDKYLAALNTTTTSNNWASLGLTQTTWNYTVYFDNTNPISQTFIRVTAPGTVPEPASLALVGLALAGVGVARRKARA